MMKNIAFGLLFLEIFLFAASWVFAASGLVTGVCLHPAPDDVVIVWAAGFIAGLIAPGAVFRLGQPVAGVLLLAVSMFNLMLWIEYGDFVLRLACR